MALLKKLRHPNIVRLHEVIDDPRKHAVYMVLELMRGPVCTTHPSRRNGPLPIEQARKYFRDICKGLKYLHTQRVVHRDVSS